MAHKTKLQKQEEAQLRQLRYSLPGERHILDRMQRLIEQNKEKNDRSFVQMHVERERDYSSNLQRLEQLEKLYGP
jgi:hypothetical protein